MIDYTAFHNYLVELVGLYQRTRSTKGMSQLAQKHHCTAITRDQFYQMKLDKLQPTQVTPQLSRVIRDTIGKSDAKAALRESIGALNEGILAGSRISQGSDRTVQITITQPVQSETPAQKPQPARQPGQPLPNYRVGQVLYWGRVPGGMLMLVSQILADKNNLTWDYALSLPSQQMNRETEKLTRNETLLQAYIGDPALRPAKGSEVARFLGALTREGYLWEADNANGLFTVKGKKQEQPVEVFVNDLPNGYHGIYALPAYGPSPYRFALRCVCAIDNAADFMSYTNQPPVVQNAVLRQLEAINGQGCDGFSEYLEYDLPTLCCTEELHEHRVAFVKVNNNGTSYWLARDRDVLRLLAWISFIV